MSANLSYHSDENVLQKLAQGDEFAFRQIYDRYWYSIYTVTRRYTKSDAFAEDIVQETFSVLWNKRASFTEVLHIEYYLITIARNLTYKALRKMAFEEAARNEFIASRARVDNSMDNILLEKQYEQLVAQAVGMLPSQQKQVFHLAKVEGLSHQDIAERLNISRLTVKTHMAKALQFVRHYLQPYVGTYMLYAILFKIIQ